MNGTADNNLADIVYDEVFICAKKLGVTQALASDLAHMVDEGVRNKCGGDKVYVPAPSKEIRDMRIINARINGEPVACIASREKMSVSGVYRICKQYGFEC